MLRELLPRRPWTWSDLWAWLQRTQARNAAAHRSHAKRRQRDLLRRVLLWSFGPVLLAIGTLILALSMVGTRDRGIFPNGLPFLILIVVWIVGYFIVRLRDQRELQREVDELNNIEKENHRL